MITRCPYDYRFLDFEFILESCVCACELNDELEDFEVRACGIVCRI